MMWSVAELDHFKWGGGKGAEDCGRVDNWNSTAEGHYKEKDQKNIFLNSFIIVNTLEQQFFEN